MPSALNFATDVAPKLLECTVDKVISDEMHAASIEKVLKFFHPEILCQFFVAGLDPADTEIQIVLPCFQVNSVSQQLRQGHALQVHVSRLEALCEADDLSGEFPALPAIHNPVQQVQMAVVVYLDDLTGHECGEIGRGLRDVGRGVVPDDDDVAGRYSGWVNHGAGQLVLFEFYFSR